MTRSDQAPHSCYQADSCVLDRGCGNYRSCLAAERERGVLIVRLHAPRGVGSDDGFTVDRPLRQAPREGEEIAFAAAEGGDAVDMFRVHVVVWYVDEPDFDAYVVLR
jgi:hypothetical protein